MFVMTNKFLRTGVTAEQLEYGQVAPRLPLAGLTIPSKEESVFVSYLLL